MGLRCWVWPSEIKRLWFGGDIAFVLALHLRACAPYSVGGRARKTT